MSHANPNVSKIKGRWKRVERWWRHRWGGVCVHEGNNAAAGKLNEWRIRGDRQ
jgi:hypothetical protein